MQEKTKSMSSPVSGVTSRTSTGQVALMNSLLGKPTKTLRIGGKKYIVVAEELKKRSEYFAKMFSGPFKESAANSDEEIQVDIPHSNGFDELYCFLLTGFFTLFFL